MRKTLNRRLIEEGREADQTRFPYHVDLWWEAYL